MKVIYPPNKAKIDKTKKSIFLAGSIEMNRAIDWQSEVIKSLTEYDVTIFNPRRLDWDSSWKQEMNDPNFFIQVDWELDRLEECDIVIMYFDITTKSPITLMELGLFASSNKLIVCCPTGFWRKGNVDMVCQRENIKQVDSLEELIKTLQLLLPK
ncbi:MAG: hypothetical protein HC836_41815 [Richelia sp. RM2_1_2]|nr:hypothetical protein [Richelia sp. RM2_1_2]